MIKQPIINVRDIRKLTITVLEHFEGLELPELASDEEENLALATAVTTHMLRLMDSAYISTSIDFVQRVKFSSQNVEGDVISTPIIDRKIIQEYISAIEKPSALVALAFKGKIATLENQDAYLILSMLHFAIFILLSHYNLSTARSLNVGILNS